MLILIKETFIKIDKLQVNLSISSPPKPIATTGVLSGVFWNSFVIEEVEDSKDMCYLSNHTLTVMRELLGCLILVI